VKALWINGWAIGETSLRTMLGRMYPKVEHIVIDPVPDWRTMAERRVMDVDQLCGYSTGAFFLLKERTLLGEARNAALFAPFVDFRAESSLGGKTRRGQLEVLIRRLRGDPLAAARDFYRRAGLSNAGLETLPYSASDLIWGIEQLRDQSASADSLRGVSARIGDKDTLLDAEAIAALGGRVEVVANAGHELEGLLRDWKEWP